MVGSLSFPFFFLFIIIIYSFTTATAFWSLIAMCDAVMTPSDRGGRDFDQRRTVSLSLSSYRRLLSCENEMFWVREGGERLGSDRHPFPHNQNERRRKRRKKVNVIRVKEKSIKHGQ